MSGAFVSVRKILDKLVANSSGVATSELDLSGQIVKQVVFATATGAHVTIKELITGELLTVTGSILFDRVITDSVTHIPVVNPTDVTGSTVGDVSQFVHPTAERVITTVATGGNLGLVNVHHYVR